MKLKIQFNSFWATGTGKAGGSLDSIVLKDEENLPYIPGKTLKGLLRDAYKEIEGKNEIFLFGHKKGNAADNLSKESLKNGNLRFNSAKIVKDRDEIVKYSYLLYKTKTAISIDDKGQAEHQSVRKNEVTIPLTLEVDLYYKNDVGRGKTDTDVADLKKACKMLRLLGEKRHRGLGRCILNVEGDSLNNENEVEKGSKEKSIKFDTTKINTNELVFKCVLNEPIILIKKDKTEHNIESLDYIPGSIFRGIVASNLFNNNSNDENINKIIFDNTVQFEDAHIKLEKQRTHKIPYSFYYRNNKKDKFLNFCDIEDWSEKTKQQKTGYFVYENEKLTCVNINYGSVIKSSRNLENRASEKGGLFTYHYLEKNQEFVFSVKSNNAEYLKDVYEILTKREHFIGKSALTEFGGAIDISLIEQLEADSTNQTNKTIKSKYIYAEGNLCFLNKYGEFTAEPTGKQLTGNDDANIDWLKSQIKTRQYAPYNGYRKNWDAERLIIEKGSVFVLQDEVEISTSKKGLFQTEGYGTILVDKDFTKQKELPYEFIEESANKTIAQKIPKSKAAILDTDNNFLKYLKENHNAIIDKQQIADSDYLKLSFKQQSNSQWARVFNATTISTNEQELENLLFNDTRGDKNCSILKGSSKKWEKKDIDVFQKILDEEANPIQLIRKIAKTNIKKEKVV